MHHVGLQLRLDGLLAEQAIEVQPPRHRERTAEPPLLPDVVAACHLQGLRAVRS
jgi:ABC-type transporter Mla subunit MlaD